MHIVFTGPESCGKTTLAEWTSLKYNLPMVPEMARVYLEAKSSYERNDLPKILQLQLHEERKFSDNHWLICDTDALTIEIWGRYRFDTDFSELIEWSAGQTRGRYYFLCDTDIPWEYDPLREHPNERHLIFQMYVDYLQKYQLPFSLLSGQLHERQKTLISKLAELGLPLSAG